jgi:TIR domain
MGPKIFISYRREADAGHAGRIFEALSERFCRRNLFMDLELRPGERWRERIQRAVGACDVLLAVIGPRWATVTKERERAALENSEDWVKVEIETALEREGVVVIPVLVGGAGMPDIDDLPASLRPITEWQAEQLNPKSWDHDLERLIRSIPHPSPVALMMSCLVCAFLAGLLASWLVKELMPVAAEQGSQAAAIAVAVARRAETWGLVGAALAGALMVARGRCPHAPSRTFGGLAVGALAGAAGGVVDALPDIAHGEQAGWVDPAALAFTGALVGALLGGLWARGRTSIGLGLGAAAGLLAHATAATPGSPGETALRVTVLVGLVVSGLAAVEMAGRLWAQRDQAGQPLPRARFP